MFCFHCFCTRSGDQEMILARNIDHRSILQKSLKQFGPVACFSLCFFKVRFSLDNTERRRTKERTKEAPSRRYSQRGIHPVPNRTGRFNLSFSRVIVR